MSTKQTITLAISLALALGLAACALEEEPTPGTSSPALPSGRSGIIKLAGQAPITVSSLQGACRQPAGPGDSDGADSSSGVLKLTLKGGDSLEIVHLAVEENCAAKIATTIKVTPPSGTTPGSILVEEQVTNPEEAADCICHFDVTALVSGLPAGNYEVSALSPAKELAGPVPVSVPGAAVSPTLQSACKKQSLENGGDSFAGSLKATPQGGGLLIEHLDVEANCAAKLAMKVTVTPPAGGKPGSIVVEELVTNPGVSANCLCRFDLSTTVPVGPGSYELTAHGPDGELAGPITVLVP